MGAKTTKQRGPKTRVEPVFISKTEIAAHLGCDTKTIDEWIKEGTVPRPHSRPGERFAVWRRAHWNTYVETGSWPSEAFASVG